MLTIGVYVLVAPEADRQQPHADDEVYVVLEGSGVLDVEGEQVSLREGPRSFVPAGAEHRFTSYEQLQRARDLRAPAEWLSGSLSLPKAPVASDGGSP
jgi:cupin superfamily acireductone dioxygenase involved in methionine salvage